ncbi:MAG: hypothetical protein FWE60_04280, partial [Oscillospiraceae bacterium]|nr:hypothetical protein [Oscillospiraceae bacterium]
YTGIGECCEPGAPPVGEANCILIDFKTPETSGLPRSGVGWTPPTGGGTITDGVLTASSTNWNSGVAFTVQLGENFLGDYGKLSFDFSATGGTTGGADNPVSVYAFGQGAIIPSGGWLGDRAGDRIGQIPYVNSATMQTLELNIGGISNQAKNFTDTFRLVIGKNQNPSTFSFGSIKLIAISCNDDCDTCDPASVPSSFTAFVSAASEASTLTYQWFMDGTIIAGAINPILAIPTGLKAGEYSFHCVVSADGAASVSSKVAVVTVIKYCPLCGEDEESDCECYRDLHVEGNLKDSVTTVTDLDVNSEIVLSGGDTIKIADMNNLILIVSVSDVTDKIEAFFDALLLWLKK